LNGLDFIVILVRTEVCLEGCASEEFIVPYYFFEFRDIIALYTFRDGGEVVYAVGIVCNQFLYEFQHFRFDLFLGFAVAETDIFDL
jgi:hypothetical protein